MNEQQWWASAVCPDCHGTGYVEDVWYGKRICRRCFEEGDVEEEMLEGDADGGGFSSG